MRARVKAAAQETWLKSSAGLHKGQKMANEVTSGSISEWLPTLMRTPEQKIKMVKKTVTGKRLQKQRAKTQARSRGRN